MAAISIVILIVALLALTGVLSGGGGGQSANVASREVSTLELRDFAGASGRAVYWAGDLPGR